MSWVGRALDGLRAPRGPRTAPAGATPVLIDDRPASGALPTLAEPERLRFIGLAMVLFGSLLLGFVVQFVGVSQLTYFRDQQLALDSFRYDLANGTAPTGQTGQDGALLAAGTPVAVLDIPAIGVHNVVVGEGTASTTMMSGPGHRRDTVLPGQNGSSVVYGRQSAYGGPFGSIGGLAVGDELTATTGQGVQTFRVIAVRHAGDAVPAQLTAGQSRLTLVSGEGLPFVPSDIVRVDADLVGTAAQTPERVIGATALGADERPMAGEGDTWPLLVLALILLAGVAVLAVIGRRLWGRWQTWVVAVPVIAAIGIFAASRVGALLPNLM